jgi:hypothetical protein
MNIRETHDLLIRQAKATRLALQAVEVAELAVRWVCQCEYVVDVSIVGLPTVSARRVAFDYATEAAQQAYDHAQEARKYAGMGRIQATQLQLDTVRSRERAVRRYASDAGLAVKTTA